MMLSVKLWNSLKYHTFKIEKKLNNDTCLLISRTLNLDLFSQMYGSHPVELKRLESTNIELALILFEYDIINP